MTSIDFTDKAWAVLRKNDSGLFIKPGPRQYPHQWNWDTSFIAIGLSHVDLDRAWREIHALLRGQWDDGMVPHIIYHTGPSDYFPTPDFWQTATNPAAPDLPTSGITQPPVLATAVRLLHERAADRALSIERVRAAYPKLLAYHRWLHKARDPENTGLVAIIHPWESGTDNAACWVEPMARITPVDLPAFKRRDQVHVGADERPSQSDYEQFIYLVDRFRRRRWESGKLYEESPFLVQNTLFNALRCRAEEDLRELASELGEPTAEIDARLERTRQAFRERLWHKDDGLYYDFDLRAQTPIRENTCACFMPLFAGVPDREAAQRLVEDHLLNDAEYAPGDSLRYYLTSTAYSSPHWQPRRYWRGPVWVVINWLLIHGLRRYGYDDLAKTVRDDTLELIDRSGFYEYYDPRDGTGCGSDDFSWTAALAIDLARESV
jgi:glycogen debranching enzyme